MGFPFGEVPPRIVDECDQFDARLVKGCPDRSQVLVPPQVEFDRLDAVLVSATSSANNHSMQADNLMNTASVGS
jgi:hypothetical protein